MERAYGFRGSLSLQTQLSCTWTLALVSPNIFRDTRNAVMGDKGDLAHSHPSPTTWHRKSVKSPVARFCRVKVPVPVPVPDDVLNSRTYQLGMVKELLVQVSALTADCLGARSLLPRLGAAAAKREGELAERMAARTAAAAVRDGAIVRCRLVGSVSLLATWEVIMELERMEGNEHGSEIGIARETTQHVSRSCVHLSSARSPGMAAISQLS